MDGLDSMAFGDYGYGIKTVMILLEDFGLILHGANKHTRYSIAEQF